MDEIHPVLLILLGFAFVVLIFVLIKDIFSAIKPKNSGADGATSKYENKPNTSATIEYTQTESQEEILTKRRERIEAQQLLDQEKKERERKEREAEAEQRRLMHVAYIAKQEQEHKEREALLEEGRRKKVEKEKALAEQQERVEAMYKEHKIQKAKEEVERKKAEIAEQIKKKYHLKQIKKIIQQDLLESGGFSGEQPKRPPIPLELVEAVYIRDVGKCVYCESTQNLQMDHIIPFSKGGATTLENLQLLCQKCNIEKSNKIGYHE